MPNRHEQEFQIDPSSTSQALVADMGSTAAVIVTHPWGTKLMSLGSSRGETMPMPVD
jgi:hypothetical protein